MSDDYFRSGLLINCFTSAIYLAYSGISAYYYNEAKSLSVDSESFNSMFIVSIIISVLSSISLIYFSYKLIMLETGKSVEKIQDVAKLNDFDLDKFRNMQNISGNIVKPSVTQPVPTENYQPVGVKPPETNINQLINSGGF